jgi:low temperature requirement protein LtrA
MDTNARFPDGTANHPDFEPVGFGQLNPATVYTSELDVGDQEVIVVPSEDHVITTADPHQQYCVAGSHHHMSALRAKIKELREQARQAAEERRLAEEQCRNVDGQLNTFQHELQQFDSVTSESSHHHTEDAFGATKIAIIEAPHQHHSHDATEYDHFPIHPPRVRQYLHEGVLHREEEERKTSWTELFWDLVLVGVISKLAHAVADEADGLAIGHFMLLFAMIFRIWVDMHQWINMTGSDDAGHRFYLAFEMLVVLGLGTNSLGAFETTGATFAAFYCISRFFRVLMYTWLDYLDPRFRLQFTLVRLCNATSGLLFLISVFVEGNARIILWIVATVGDIWYYTLVVIALRKKLFGGTGYAIALNIEHQSERMGLFVIIVLGESIVGVLYDNLANGVRMSFLKAAFGLLIAYNMHWIYFTVDGSRQYQHAIRRSATTSFMWNLAHLPLTAFLTAAGGVLRYLVLDGETVTALASGGGAGGDKLQARIWIYCVGCGLALCTMAFIGILHKSADKEGSTRLSKTTRLAVRFLIGILWIVTPLFHTSSVGVMAILTSTGIPVTFCEAWGRMSKRPEGQRRRSSFWRAKTFQVDEKQELEEISGLKSA